MGRVLDNRHDARVDQPQTTQTTSNATLDTAEVNSTEQKDDQKRYIRSDYPQERDRTQASTPTAHGTRQQLHLCTYTDGASRGNPGPAACGGVIYRIVDKRGPSTKATSDPIDTFAKLLGRATNNEAEYRGLEMGLARAIELGATQVTAYVDSLLVCKQIRGEYSIKHNTIRQLHNRCRALIHKLQEFTIEHTLRVYNVEADEQCNMALDSIQAEASRGRRHPDRPVDLAWAEFCKNWHKDKARSLVMHYPSEQIERKELPLYTMIDKPNTMAKRARLRFRRAQFGHNNRRINLPSNTHCDHEECDGKELQEDTEHVLMVCPRNARERDKLRDDMATLLGSSAPQTNNQLLSMILGLPHTRTLEKMAQDIGRITGEFILAVYRNKQF